MAEKVASKVVLGGKVIVDLTADTVEESKLLEGYAAHGSDGQPITGTCTFDADTQDATAKDSEMLSGVTAYVRGVKLTGKMKNNGSVSGKISTKAGTYTVPQGYHDGSGSVQIDSAEQAKIIPANIRQGVTVLGVTGSMSGAEGVKAQSKTATPSMSQQSIVPDSGFTHLSEVVINPIPVVETENAAGGLTITIG